MLSRKIPSAIHRSDLRFILSKCTKANARTTLINMLKIRNRKWFGHLVYCAELRAIYLRLAVLARPWGSSTPMRASPYSNTYNLFQDYLQ